MTFDEYDIYSFLIFIRRHLSRRSFPLVIEFADSVAHRERDQGKIYDNIKNSISSDYSIIDGHVVGYHGYDIQSWNDEWQRVLNRFGIVSNNRMIREITFCIFSLFQETKYKSNGRIIGKIKLLFNYGHSEIALLTSECTDESLLVVFAKLDNVKIYKKDIFLDDSVETYRENGVLKMRNSLGIICEITD